MTKAKIIIADARKKLMEFIRFEAPLMYKKLGWAEPDDDEDYEIFGSDLCRTIRINVEVDNSYLDVEDTCYEDVEVASIIVSRDGDILVTSEDDEWDAERLSIEELADIAEVLELSYTK